MAKKNWDWRRPWTEPTTEVLYTKQDLTPEQQDQARKNIGAAAVGEGGGGGLTAEIVDGVFYLRQS